MQRRVCRPQVPYSPPPGGSSVRSALSTAPLLIPRVPTAPRAGTLAALCGGDKWAFEHVKPIIDSFSSHSDLFGPAGSGHAVKVGKQAYVCARGRSCSRVN